MESIPHISAEQSDENNDSDVPIQMKNTNSKKNQKETETIAMMGRMDSSSRCNQQLRKLKKGWCEGNNDLGEVIIR